MLTGKTIDLELVERAELVLLHGWVNDVDFVGEFEPFDQVSLASLEKDFDAGGTGQMYFIRKKDGTRIGYVAHFKVKDCTGIGYMLVPGERGRGYGVSASPRLRRDQTPAATPSPMSAAPSQTCPGQSHAGPNALATRTHAASTNCPHTQP